MGFRTVFIESPCRCSYQGGYMVVRKEDGTAKIHLSEISTVLLQTQQAYISAYLLSELAKSKISLVISNEQHNPVGQYLPLYGAHNTSKRIVEQMAWGEPIKKRVWQRVVKDKIEQQAALLEEREYPRASVRALKSAAGEVRSGDVTNREAQAARIYFSVLFGDDFVRLVDTPVNSALDYGYAILLSMVNREIVSRGFLTQCGICHRNEYNQFNLACDLMEPFRPAVDRLIVDCFAIDFDSDMKRILVDLANTGAVYRGGTYRLGSVVGLYVQDCLNALNKKIAVDDIEPFGIL
ncbi:type II CRISPR-associated endonuclease Cas1 [Slackia exigua]|uniref:type II CRISPR-associated endonuclease Cas1 n=1 Tax=Slackia exigua TaxID=84109 RepID=UPI00254DF73C|nr:type II CRISPR-associated endonuclease Cas1 [Slackia exigua]MDK7724655.1 type II CRISPR-associated endonuclease Cas1 [Slackia exigua]MDK7726263.1 type II CRISPR-associated endonuclease Cas1 [Slackia exigua]